MLPTIEHYRQYGETLGREMRENLGHPVDWEGFSQMKSWDHGILPDLRALCGFDDPSDRGTYTQAPAYECHEALDAMISGFRHGATTEET